MLETRVLRLYAICLFMNVTIRKSSQKLFFFCKQYGIKQIDRRTSAVFFPPPAEARPCTYEHRQVSQIHDASLGGSRFTQQYLQQVSQMCHVCLACWWF